MTLDTVGCSIPVCCTSADLVGCLLDLIANSSELFINVELHIAWEDHNSRLPNRIIVRVHLNEYFEQILSSIELSYAVKRKSLSHIHNILSERIR